VEEWEGWSQGKFPTLFQFYIKALAGSYPKIAHAFSTETGADTRLAHCSSPQSEQVNSCKLEQKKKRRPEIRRKLASCKDVACMWILATLRTKHVEEREHVPRAQSSPITANTFSTTTGGKHWKTQKYVRMAVVLGGPHGDWGLVSATQVPDCVSRNPAVGALSRCMATDSILSRHGRSLSRRCAVGMAVRAEDVWTKTWADSRARRQLAPGGPGILGRLHRG
jgi:hypothetical protein